MTNLGRILCCAAAIYFGIGRNVGPLTGERSMNQERSRALPTADVQLPRGGGFNSAQLNNRVPDSELYRSIVDRNAFGLMASPPGEPGEIAARPRQVREDLILTGLVELGAARMAFFTISDPNGGAFYFSLPEGKGNAWLDVRSVDVKKGAVRVLLKQPVVRIQNAGTEVLLSFKAHGQRN